MSEAAAPAALPGLQQLLQARKVLPARAAALLPDVPLHAWIAAAGQGAARLVYQHADARLPMAQPQARCSAAAHLRHGAGCCT